jgi:hypothetical protein
MTMTQGDYLFLLVYVSRHMDNKNVAMLFIWISNSTMEY